MTNKGPIGLPIDLKVLCRVQLISSSAYAIHLREKHKLFVNYGAPEYLNLACPIDKCVQYINAAYLNVHVDEHFLTWKNPSPKCK